jgi:hypothetical protein
MTHKILKKHLKENNIIPIYLYWKEHKEFRGNARLIERLVDKEPPEEDKTYEFKEIGDDTIFDRKKDKVSILYSYQSWVIEFVDGKDKGFKTRVNVSYYKSTLYNREKNE